MQVFGPAPDGIKYKENDRYNSTNPYSATKAGGEELAVAYENTYKYANLHYTYNECLWRASASREVYSNVY